MGGVELALVVGDLHFRTLTTQLNQVGSFVFTGLHIGRSFPKFVVFSESSWEHLSIWLLGSCWNPHRI